MTAQRAIELYNAGLLTHDECVARLETMQIRGGFQDAGNANINFVGYDYRNQAWIDYTTGRTS